jgi:outer membrane protein assembly factor BamB
LIDSGIVYASDLEGSVWAWDADNGRLLEGFPYESGDPVRAKPLFSEDRGAMLIMTRSKHVHFIDPTNGLGIWTSADLEDSSLPNRVLADPILQNGRMLINDDRGLVLEITPLEEILAGGDYQTELSIIRLAGS